MKRVGEWTQLMWFSLGRVLRSVISGLEPTNLQSKKKNPLPLVALRVIPHRKKSTFFREMNQRSSLFPVPHSCDATSRPIWKAFHLHISAGWGWNRWLRTETKHTKDAGEGGLRSSLSPKPIDRLPYGLWQLKPRSSPIPTIDSSINLVYIPQPICQMDQPQIEVGAGPCLSARLVLLLLWFLVSHGKQHLQSIGMGNNILIGISDFSKSNWINESGWTCYIIPV